jgi:hypothetical protein
MNTYLKDVAVLSLYYKLHIDSLHFCFMQLWDLHDILQGFGKTVDSDSDEMETETSLPKNNKGIPGLLQNFV